MDAAKVRGVGNRGEGRGYLRWGGGDSGEGREEEEGASGRQCGAAESGAWKAGCGKRVQRAAPTFSVSRFFSTPDVPAPTPQGPPTLHTQPTLTFTCAVCTPPKQLLCEHLSPPASPCPPAGPPPAPPPPHLLLATLGHVNLALALPLALQDRRALAALCFGLQGEAEGVKV